MTAVHEELAGVVLAGRDLPDVLTEITDIGNRAMTPAEASSITLVRGDKAVTAAFRGRLALDAEEMQYQRGYGPCLDAGRAGMTFLVSDMRNDERWPDYARQASERGVGSSLSVPLPFQGATIGAFNAYSTRVEAFSDDDVALGAEVATWLAIAAGNAAFVGRSAEDLANLRQAMESRSTIEQAKGILMERHKTTADGAFTLLTRASQNTNVKLRTVADHLVQTGELLSGDHPARR